MTTIADQLMQKLALNRLSKEIFRRAETSVPGIRRTIANARLPLETPSAQEAAKRVGGELQTLSDKIYRSRQFRYGVGSPGSYERPLGVADYKARLRESYSGRHAAKPGEFLIPSHGPETVSNPTRAAGSYLYRGNAVPAGAGEVTYMSRHPDVAADYATGGTSGQAAVQNKVHVYRRNDLAGRFQEQGMSAVDPSDLADLATYKKYRARAHDQRDMQFFDEPRRTREFTAQSAYYVPTYEALVPNAAATAPVGTYRVRKARTPDGNPAYALSHESGIPAEEAFR